MQWSRYRSVTMANQWPMSRFKSTWKYMRENLDSQFLPLQLGDSSWKVTQTQAKNLPTFSLCISPSLLVCSAVGFFMIWCCFVWICYINPNKGLQKYCDKMWKSSKSFNRYSLHKASGHTNMFFPFGPVIQPITDAIGSGKHLSTPTSRVRSSRDSAEWKTLRSSRTFQSIPGA